MVKFAYAGVSKTVNMSVVRERGRVARCFRSGVNGMVEVEERVASADGPANLDDGSSSVEAARLRIGDLSEYGKVRRGREEAAAAAASRKAPMPMLAWRERMSAGGRSTGIA